MTAPARSSAPVTSWWYGQGGAVGVVRRLEALYTLNPAPAAAGLVTARRDELTVTFVEALRAPLPQPWHQEVTGSEARIAWGATDPGIEPDPGHPVYLVVFGTTDDGGLVAINLAAFSRLRIDGDRATTTALVRRWVLELLATHPDITLGVSADVWAGPLTTRVKPVSAGAVPQVDVLICGPELSYTDRAQIVSNTTSSILVDLGTDAAVDTKWTILCGADQVGQISNGASRPMIATLIVPTSEAVARCCDLLTASPAAALKPPPAEPGTGEHTTVAPSSSLAAATAERVEECEDAGDGGIDFFAAGPDAGDGGIVETPSPTRPDEQDQPEPSPAPEPESSPEPEPESSPEPEPESSPEPEPSPAPAAVAAGMPHNGEDTGLPVVAPVWNRLLGQVALCPPHPGQEPGPREKRVNELLVFLQLNPWVNSAEIIRRIYGGAAAERTVTQQMSQLRTRLGNVRPGGPKALPAMREGGFHLDSAVRSDWMEFERLVEILVETTPTGHLIAAMGLVTGAPLGTITPKEWPWTTDLREEMRDRVPAAAVVLARRHYEANKFSDAIEIARKGLWYDTGRQDLWQIGMQAALDGHDHEAFKALRGQYLNTVAGPDRDPAVFDLTKRPG